MSLVEWTMLADRQQVTDLLTDKPREADGVVAGSWGAVGMGGC